MRKKFAKLGPKDITAKKYGQYWKGGAEKKPTSLTRKDQEEVHL